MFNTPTPIQQILISMSLLNLRGKDSVAYQTLEDFQKTIFFSAFNAFQFDHVQKLVNQNYLKVNGDHLQLTSEGKKQGDALRYHYPKARFFYDEFFLKADSSPTHQKFCEQVYGMNLCQHGMATMNQLQILLDSLNITQNDRVLELGCGNGRITQWLQAQTGAFFTGIDLSPVGIQQAQMRMGNTNPNLNFQVENLNEFVPEVTPYQFIIAIDLFPFIQDPEALLTNLQTCLAPGGTLVIFWSAWKPDHSPESVLSPKHNHLASILDKNNWSYQFLDFSVQEREHWKQKHEALFDLKNAFEQENNHFLYNYRFMETSSHQTYVNNGNLRRFLYLCTK